VASMIERVWASLLFAINFAAAAIVAWCYLVPAPALPAPLRPYREVSRCASGPLDWRLFDANGDDRPDIVILCEEELLVASGLNGDTLWRQDLPWPFAGSFGAFRWLHTEGSPVLKGGVIVVEFPKGFMSFDAATGRTLLSESVAHIHPEIDLEGDCLIVKDGDAPSRTISARSGEPCTVSERPPVERKPTGRFARVEHDGRDGHHTLTLERGGEELWTASCDSVCSAQVTPGGVLAAGRLGDRCMRILNFARGQVVRVLKPQDEPWTLESLPPYLVAWRPLYLGPSRTSRPVLEVFDATSFRTLWRSEPDGPEAIWVPTDHCEPSLPDTSESPLPLTSTDVVDGPCVTGIAPRAATGKDDVVLRLERTAPIYQVTILADGRVHYDGKSVDGAADQQLTMQQLDALTRSFRENRFFDLCDATITTAFDTSRMTVHFWDGTHVKRVEADWANRDQTAALGEFGDMIDEAVAIEQIVPSLRQGRAW
jgi:hypothetical protein